MRWFSMILVFTTDRAFTWHAMTPRHPSGNQLCSGSFDRHRRRRARCTPIPAEQKSSGAKNLKSKVTCYTTNVILTICKPNKISMKNGPFVDPDRLLVIFWHMKRVRQRRAKAAFMSGMEWILCHLARYWRDKGPSAGLRRSKLSLIISLVAAFCSNLGKHQV